MDKTPSSNRITIAFYGRRNAGKSQLLNGITGQEVAVVSPVPGTTTDPVKKAMEFHPLGPVLFIDTAGLDDEGELGRLRVGKTRQIIDRTDFAVYVMDINDPGEEEYRKTTARLKELNIPYLSVINKTDTAGSRRLAAMKAKYPEAVFLSAVNPGDLEGFKKILVEKIQNSSREKEPPLVGDLIPYNGKVVLVVPIDAQAPKGRLILPQVQVIRDCLDHGIKSYVVRDTELASALEDLDGIDLVITDSQVFKEVARIVPESIKLTSFSILFARYKGDFTTLFSGIKSLEQLPDPARILIAENCTHNPGCEDIGRVKIPVLLRKNLPQRLEIETVGGKELPANLDEYDLVIHCGGCMLNRRAMQSRLLFFREHDIPVTNYGMVLAYFNGILERATEIFSHVRVK
ncbi:MAG TPA: [FeFe] hydrogenase H-cluster maturation GTPase HydF [Firmicutes bacterium]|jgi:[FeFe] hydrogenase H-cluster maturation GTPase HydF|nr:[FeFe] hydrogenase H-cluster maturation GTPase HydF [Bacillota bacterium]